MYVIQPGTDAVVWIPGTDNDAAKVKSGLSFAEVRATLTICGLVFLGLGLLLETMVESDHGVGVLLIVAGTVFAALGIFSFRCHKNAGSRLSNMLEEYRALYTDNMLYRLLAAQLLIASARNLGDLLNDRDDAAVYERIVADFAHHPDTVALIKAYDDAVEQKDRIHQMTAHAALVAKIGGVVEDLIGAYRMQHQ